MSFPELYANYSRDILCFCKFCIFYIALNYKYTSYISLLAECASVCLKGTNANVSLIVGTSARVLRGEKVRVNSSNDGSGGGGGSDGVVVW